MMFESYINGLWSIEIIRDYEPFVFFLTDKQDLKCLIKSQKYKEKF